MQGTDETFMALALGQARTAESMGEVPIGAVVVCDGAVVASGYNRREPEIGRASWRERV